MLSVTEWGNFASVGVMPNNRELLLGLLSTAVSAGNCNCERHGGCATALAVKGAMGSALAADVGKRAINPSSSSRSSSSCEECEEGEDE